MDEPIATAEGTNGIMSVFEDRLEIRRKGVGSLFLQGLKGVKTIQLSNISAIQLKKAGITTGYIQVSFLGGQESKGGIFSATRDENTVLFKKSQQSSFEAIRAAVQERISRRPEPVVGVAEEIGKLARLRDDGVLTDEEFDAKKRQLLGL
jgi:hypothetical protein